MRTTLRLRTRLVAALACALATTTVTGLVPATTPSADAATSRRVDGVVLTTYEARLVQLVNKTRADKGLKRLKVTPCAEDFARRWTKTMAREDTLYHNPALTDLWTARHCDKTTYVAENVGYSWSETADQVFAAYMNSPGHRANILSKKSRFIGIGAITRADGKVYNTMNFTNGASADYGRCKVAGEDLAR